MDRSTQVFDIEVRVDLRRELWIAVPEQSLDLDQSDSPPPGQVLGLRPAPSTVFSARARCGR